MCWLTCPECCNDELHKLNADVWVCERCGTKFDFAKLRKILGELTGREFTDDFIRELLGDARGEVARGLGERGWKWSGTHGVLYTLDVGNGWYYIVRGEPSAKRKHR